MKRTMILLLVLFSGCLHNWEYNNELNQLQCPVILIAKSKDNESILRGRSVTLQDNNQTIFHMHNPETAADIYESYAVGDTVFNCR